MKKYITMGMLIFGSLGGWIGSLIDHTGFGAASIILSTIGGLLGIWLGYKAGQNWG